MTCPPPPVLSALLHPRQPSPARRAEEFGKEGGCRAFAREGRRTSSALRRGIAEGGYAVGQRRRRARSAVTCPPQPVLSRLPRLRVLVQRKSMELPTRIVVGFYKKGGSSARISIRSILDEASNVDTEFAAGRSPEFAGGRRSAEFAEGRRTAVELSNLACVGYNRDGAKGGGAAARLYELQQQTDIWPAGRTQL